MGGELEIFPRELLTADKEDEVVLLLRQLPVPPRRKKQALIAWCKFVGAALTKDLVERVLGPLDKYV